MKTGLTWYPLWSVLYFSLFLPGPRLPSDLLAVFEFIVRCLSSPHLLLKSTDVNFFSICQDIYHLFNTQFLAPCFILYFYPSQFKRKILLVLLVLHSGSNSTSAIYLSKYFEVIGSIMLHFLLSRSSALSGHSESTHLIPQCFLLSCYFYTTLHLVPLY